MAKFTDLEKIPCSVLRETGHEAVSVAEGSMGLETFKLNGNLYFRKGSGQYVRKCKNPDCEAKVTANVWGKKVKEGGQILFMRREAKMYSLKVTGGCERNR